MVDPRPLPKRDAPRTAPYVDSPRDTAPSPGGVHRDSGRRVANTVAHSPWRQWRSQPATIDTTPPLEVTAPKRPQYGRYLYMAIIFGLAFYGLNMAYTHTFWLNASGSVGGRQFVLSPSQTVRVESVMVEPSDVVAEGQPLVGFSSPRVEQELAETLMTISELEQKIALGGQDPNAANTIDSLRAEIQALESEQIYLSEQYRVQRDEQVTPLWDLVAEGAIGPSALQEAEAELRLISSKRDQAAAKQQGLRSRLHQLQQTQSDGRKQDQAATLDRLRASLTARSDDLVLRAPAAGVIAQVPVETGETLNAGHETVRLVQRETLRSYLYFPPAASTRLEAGQTLAITLPSGQQVDTRISKIYPSVQAVPEDAWPSPAKANAASVVVAVDPADAGAMQAMVQVESGTPVNARVARWHLPDLNAASERLKAFLSPDEGGEHLTAAAGG